MGDYDLLVYRYWSSGIKIDHFPQGCAALRMLNLCNLLPVDGIPCPPESENSNFFKPPRFLLPVDFRLRFRPIFRLGARYVQPQNRRLKFLKTQTSLFQNFIFQTCISSSPIPKNTLRLSGGRRNVNPAKLDKKR